jgi:DNA-binding NtrC family response regulator
MPNDNSVPHGSGETVLVIEDDRDMRELVEMMLRHLGYAVVCSVDASTARRALDENPQISVVLSDVVLPGGTSGPDLAKELRSTHPKTRVLFMSGYPMDLVSADECSDTSSDTLRKPFRLALLARATRKALDL